MTAFIGERIIMAGVVLVFLAVLLDFVIYNGKDGVKKGRRSIVATGSMTIFFAVFCLVIYLRWGYVDFEGTAAIISGTAMVAFGAAVNIAGRLKLGGNWANHIKIYDGHTLVKRGIYKIIRHPLYASIMLMLLGGSAAYRNWLAASLTACIFIPFMYYRAKQEEKLLREEFADYQKYIEATGMFFPKLPKLRRRKDGEI
jgi:protein-S-isoprenylcysteine O-methyltransferase Ste14